jgi:hypothetical protein
MPPDPLKNLVTALSSVFTAEDTVCLARLMLSAAPNGEMLYEAVDLPAEIKDEWILEAFEERLLLPRLSRPGGAWQDRLLTMQAGAVYVLPPVVQVLIEAASISGVLDPSGAVSRTLPETDETKTAQRVQLFDTLKHHAVAFQLEAGLMNILNSSYTPGLDLHDSLDQFVWAGMMSPCPARSMKTGLAWYEINRALCWRKPSARPTPAPSSVGE